MTGRENQGHLVGDDARDVAFEALVLSDPAGASVPDPERLWPLVMARTQEDGAGEYGTSSSGGSSTLLVDVPGAASDESAGVVVNLAARGRRRFVRVAAAAAVVAVAAGGGYAIGTQRAPGAADVVASAPPVLGAESVEDPAEEADEPQRLAFVVGDLPEGPGTASVWVLDPSVDPSAPSGDLPTEGVLADDLFEDDGTLVRGELVGELPLVTVEEAAERLGDPVYAVSRDRGAPLVATASDPADVPDGQVPWGVIEVSITGADVSSEIVRGGDGRDWVVPVYAFTDGRDNVWRVLALQDDAMDLVG